MSAIADAKHSAGGGFGRYELLFPIASGGMADVFAARIRGEGQFERYFAIKRMARELTRHEKFVQSFLDEARITACIHSPHVVQVVDLGRADDGAPYLVMELIRGVSLTVLTRSVQDTLPLAVVVRIGIEAAMGLSDAHLATDARGERLGIVHRDVSPQNVLLGIDGRVRIADFGIARAKQRLASGTQSGELKGKFGYFAPEQLRGNADSRTDVFALGIVLWELIANTKLFHRSEVLDTLMNVERMEIPRLDKVRDDIPTPLADTIAKALSRDSDERYQSAADFVTALRELFETRAVLPPPERTMRALALESAAPLLSRLQEAASGEMPALQVESESGRDSVTVPSEPSISLSVTTGVERIDLFGGSDDREPALEVQDNEPLLDEPVTTDGKGREESRGVERRTVTDVNAEARAAWSASVREQEPPQQQEPEHFYANGEKSTRRMMSIPPGVPHRAPSAVPENPPTPAAFSSAPPAAFSSAPPPAAFSSAPPAAFSSAPPPAAFHVDEPGTEAQAERMALTSRRTDRALPPVPTDGERLSDAATSPHSVRPQSFAPESTGQLSEASAPFVSVLTLSPPSEPPPSPSHPFAAIPPSSSAPTANVQSQGGQRRSKSRAGAWLGVAVLTLGLALGAGYVLPRLWASRGPTSVGDGVIATDSPQSAPPGRSPVPTVAGDVPTPSPGESERGPGLSSDSAAHETHTATEAPPRSAAEADAVSGTASGAAVASPDREEPRGTHHRRRPRPEDDTAAAAPLPAPVPETPPVAAGGPTPTPGQRPVSTPLDEDAFDRSIRRLDAGRR